MGSFVRTLAQNTRHFNMKFLVLAAFVAVSSAQTLVTYPNGAVVPADTLEVQAARAAHLGAAVYPYAYAYGYPTGLVGHANGAHAAAGGVVRPVGHIAYAGLVAHPNGAVVPVEPVDVVNARAEHLAAHQAA